MLKLLQLTSDSKNLLYLLYFVLYLLVQPSNFGWNVCIFAVIFMKDLGKTIIIKFIFLKIVTCAAFHRTIAWIIFLLLKDILFLFYLYSIERSGAMMVEQLCQRCQG